MIADPPDYEKAMIPFEQKSAPNINWVSKYGSITFNNEGLDFPDGGVTAEVYAKRFAGWINIAKRSETKANRIRESIILLEREEKLGLR